MKIIQPKLIQTRIAYGGECIRLGENVNGSDVWCQNSAGIAKDFGYLWMKLLLCASVPFNIGMISRKKDCGDPVLPLFVLKNFRASIHFPR